MANSEQMNIRCPYCGETTDIHVDIETDEEDVVEDCTVCCRPILLHVERDETGNPSVSAATDSE